MSARAESSSLQELSRKHTPRSLSQARDSAHGEVLAHRVTAPSCSPSLAVEGGGWPGPWRLSPVRSSQTWGALAGAWLWLPVWEVLFSQAEAPWLVYMGGLLAGSQPSSDSHTYSFESQGNLLDMNSLLLF